MAIAPHLITAQVVPVLSHLYGGAKNGTARHYRLVRRAGTRFTLKFPEPIKLPIAVGADAHFGLGQFEPIIDGSSCNSLALADTTANALALISILI